MAHLDPTLRGKYTDTSVHLGDGSVLKVHKCLLALHSEMYRMLLNYAKGKTRLLKTISIDGFPNILNWIYEVLFSVPCINFTPFMAIKIYCISS
jgi:hypothetical protein